MSSSGHWFNKEIKATVRIEGEVSMSVGDDPRNVPFVKVYPLRYYLPDADMDETRAKLLKAGFRLHPRSADAAVNAYLRAAEGEGCNE